MAFRKNKTIYPNRDAIKFYSYVTTYKTLWRAFKERLIIEKDVFILISGTTGSGKSTLAGKINFRHALNEVNFIKYPKEAGEYNEKIRELDEKNKNNKELFEESKITEEEYNNEISNIKRDKKQLIKEYSDKMMFIPEKHFIVDEDEFAVKMITEQGSVIWYDEAREGVNRQDWYNKINKAIKKRKNTNRKNFNVCFIIMPLEVELDPKLEGHLTAWIWVRRGIGEIYVPNTQRKGGRGLNIQSIIKREEKYLNENPKRTISPPIIHPEYVGRIAFGKFNKNEDKMYKYLVDKKQAIGKLTDEEKEKYGIENKRDPETIITDVISQIGKEIKDKKTLWEKLKEIEESQDKKIKTLNFYLKLNGFSTFDKLFSKSKVKQIEVDW